MLVYEFIPIVLLAAALGYWLRWRQTLSWALREVQSACNHRWGPPHSLYDQGRMNEWYRHCIHCGKQQNGHSEKGPWKVL